MPRVGAAVLRARYIRGLILPYGQAVYTFGAAGLVLLVPIDVPWPIIIDRIVYQVAATSAGNVRAGIYKEGATADSPAGAALVVESASVSQSAASCLQFVTVADTLLTPGQYFVAIQPDGSTGTCYIGWDSAQLIGKYYSRAGGYGAFTDPCPAVTMTQITPALIVRIKENLPAGYRL